jgi:hypothetical protein
MYSFSILQYIGKLAPKDKFIMVFKCSNIIGHGSHTKGKTCTGGIKGRKLKI